MPGVMITAEQSKELEQLLSSMLVQTEAQSVYMCDYAGNIIHRVVTTEQGPMEQTIAALASGSFVATNELAMLIGEATFHSVYHKGERASIYMQSLGKDYLVLVIFSNTTTIGLVKLYVDRTCQELGSLLGVVETQKEIHGQEFALDENAQLFGAPKPPNE